MHVVVLLGVPLACFLFALAVAEFAFAWWGHPCACIPSEVLGQLCADQCMTFAGVEVRESVGKPVLTIAMPIVGAVVAETVFQWLSRHEC